MQQVYLYGASGHAKVIRDIVEACGDSVTALLDDNPAVEELQGIRVIHEYHGESPMIISIGSNRIRKMLANKLSADFVSAIHPSAIVSESCTVGKGTVVMQGCVLQAESKIGAHCIINTGAGVDHECEIDDFVHVSPHATLCGNVSVGEGTWIGAGSTVIQGIHIGKWCIIGAGSVVTRDVPDGYLAVGVPCRLVRIINEEMLNFENQMGGVNGA